ncbi:hypothetical protein AOL_s00109g70 [Orbilia oligospora ATCC 24927]|uniref:Uncharacterized protein n=1 Tax=Arthrobotrys oligospora (strain ATCC 24927 / CBS 115.81 / DSM 1491) TaxID=756982 RepID=G1XK41_ARTOA|nr:hypothetical protein AOL_s00109g70 [Orbilia oligospora ATCC 24927]EGX46498.1 hypothetical protein AOL_s00109g70 [Orbilia oligospora ATCC 24927]
MSTPRRPHRQKPYIPKNKENITTGISSPTPRSERRRQTIIPPSKTHIGSDNEEYDQRQGIYGARDEYEEGEGEDGTPFVGFSERDIMALRSVAAQKMKTSGGRGYGRQGRRGLAKFEVLRDVTGDFVNREQVGRGTPAGKGKRRVLEQEEEGELVEESERTTTIGGEGSGDDDDEEEEEEGEEGEGVGATVIEVDELEEIQPSVVQDIDDVEEPEISFTEEERALNMTILEPNHEAYIEQSDVESDIEPSSSPIYCISPPNTPTGSLDNNAENSDTASIFTTSSEDLNTITDTNNRILAQPPRTDNTALRNLLHPSSYTDLRTTHLSDVALSKEWHVRKCHLLNTHPDRVREDPFTPPPDQTPYKRPKSRKIPRLIAKPAVRLWRHLGLYDPESRPARKLLGWLRKEDEALLSQISLVAPRMELQHIREVHEHAFQPLRVRLLKYLRENYQNCTWCLLFSEFVYMNARHILHDYNTTVNGSCLFLMVSTNETGKIKQVAEGMLRNMRFGDELAVFVKSGNSRFFGSYGLVGGKGEYEDEEDEEEEEEEEEQKPHILAQGGSRPGVRVGWPSFFFPKAAQTTSLETDTPPQKTIYTPYTPPNPNPKSKSSPSPKFKPKPTPDSNANSKSKSESPSNSPGTLSSLSLSPTPPPHSPMANIHKIRWDQKLYQHELDAFTYGLRWIARLDIPSSDEGLKANYQDRPNIGNSLSAKGDYGSGTLAGYMTDRRGRVYAMTCHHVMYFDNHASLWPHRSNYIINASSCQPICPSIEDITYETRAIGHQIDGLMHEAICAYTRGKYALAETLTRKGKEKLKLHDKLVEEYGKGGTSFGGTVASAWRIAQMKDGPWIMDQVVIKPKIERIGTNTFTYTGRDNKGGRRFRVEARGWTNLPIGAEVLKIGRTTGLTKGTVLSLNADVRIMLGKHYEEHPEIHKVQRYWEVKCGIVSAGSGPWFSDPGDSGAWVLSCPSFEDMLKWDLRRAGGKGVADPIPAPVGGLLFGGADSVDGINLTFYNPTKMVRTCLIHTLGEQLGRELRPGFGGEIIPTPLSEEWEEQDSWSRQNKLTANAWAGFVNHGFWKYQMKRYPDDHVFRSRRWWDEWERKLKNVTQDLGFLNFGDKGRDYDTIAEMNKRTMFRATGFKGNNTPDLEQRGPEEGEEETAKVTPQATQRQSSKLKIRFEELTPRRRGTTDDIPDTPVSTLPKIRRVGPPYVPIERLMREATPGKYTPNATTNRKVGGAYTPVNVRNIIYRPGYKMTRSGRKISKTSVTRIEKDDGESDDSLGRAIRES